MFGLLPLTATGSCPSDPTGLSTSSTASWLQASASVGPFGASVSLFTDANFTGAPRTAVIVVNGQALITFTQGTASCVSSVTPTTHAYPVTGGTVTFQVETTTPDCFWSVTGFPGPPLFSNPLGPGWATPSGTNSYGRISHLAAYDIGTRSFDVSASSNAFSSTPRSVTLTFGGMTTATITQPAPTCQFTFSPASVNVPANGGSATVNLTGTGTDCSYTASPATGSNWVTVTAGASGSAPATISVTVAPNTSVSERTGQVVAVNGVLGIVQAGSPIALDFGTTSGIGFGAARQPNGTLRVTSSQPIRVTNAVEPNASWNATTSEPWIVVTPASGTTPATMRVSIDPVVVAAQPPGSMSGFIDIFSSTAPQTPRRLFVVVQHYNGVPGSQEPLVFGAVPYGAMDTPTEGATGLSGAVPITGWAIDRVGITTIRIYRASVAGEPQGLVYIGDAIRVFGARPDLLMGFGGFPESRLGGWGLMLLSNVLPGGGSGTFTFFAYAEDFEGNNTLLGTKTVTFDNATATKPFGTIDVPAQGQTVSRYHRQSRLGADAAAQNDPDRRLDHQGLHRRSAAPGSQPVQLSTSRREGVLPWSREFRWSRSALLDRYDDARRRCAHHRVGRRGRCRRGRGDRQPVLHRPEWRVVAGVGSCRLVAQRRHADAAADARDRRLVARRHRRHRLGDAGGGRREGEQDAPV